MVHPQLGRWVLGKTSDLCENWGREGLVPLCLEALDRRIFHFSLHGPAPNTQAWSVRARQTWEPPQGVSQRLRGWARTGVLPS